MRCGNGHENPEGQRFCGQCGAPLQASEPTDAGRASEPPTPEEAVTSALSQPPPETGPGPRIGAVPSPPAETPSAAPLLSAPPHHEGTRSRRMWLVAAVLVALVAGGFGGYFGTRGGQSARTKYLSALTKNGLMSQFATSTAALNAANAFCATLNTGVADQGTPVQQVEVEYMCPSYSRGFTVLQTISVTGTFEISNETYTPGGYTDPNWQTLPDGSCGGSGGYGDIGESETVVVANQNGTVLTQTTLGTGTANGNTYDSSSTCDFTFTFSITQGQSEYVVTVGHRGSEDYTFAQLQQPDAISLVIGNS